LINFLGSIGSFFSGLLSILLALVVIMIMIVIHEAGHYTTGKLLKFKINEFSIGFGKALFQRTSKTGEVFAIRMIPLGGYCAFEGEDEDNPDNPEAFNNQAWWKRLIVLFSGAFFNFVSAILFSVVLLAVVGAGYVDVNTLTIQPTQYVAGSDVLQVNDTIVRVNGEKCTLINGGLNGLISEIKDDTTVITLTIERVENGEKVRKDINLTKHVALNEDGTVKTNSDGEVVYEIGIVPRYHNYSIGGALLRAVPFAFELAWANIVIIFKLLTGQLGLSALGGTVTTISTIATASQAGLINLLWLFPVIAISLAVVNLMPIPALDGARMVFVLIEGIRRKPINRDLEAKIHTVGLFVLFGFAILLDVLQIFVY